MAKFTVPRLNLKINIALSTLMSPQYKKSDAFNSIQSQKKNDIPLVAYLLF